MEYFTYGIIIQFIMFTRTLQSSVSCGRLSCLLKIWSRPFVQKLEISVSRL